MKIVEQPRINSRPVMNRHGDTSDDNYSRPCLRLRRRFLVRSRRRIQLNPPLCRRGRLAPGLPWLDHILELRHLAERREAAFHFVIVLLHVGEILPAGRDRFAERGHGVGNVLLPRGPGAQGLGGEGSGSGLMAAAHML